LSWGRAEWQQMCNNQTSVGQLNVLQVSFSIPAAENENSEGFMDQKNKIVVTKLMLVSIIGNVLLSAFKMIAGFVGGSSAMISDAVHSISDILTTFIALIGVKLSQKQADKEHPYGHERMECIASMMLSAVLVLVSFEIGKAGLMHILKKDALSVQVPSEIALVAAIVSILGKEAMYRYTVYHARRIGSDAFIADAWHHRSDAISSVGALIGIGFSMLGYPIMDSIASIVIAGFILKAAGDIMKDAVKKITDTSCGEAFEKEIIILAEKFDDVIGIDNIQTRRFGSKVYIDLEIRVEGSKNLCEAHDIAENIHETIENKFPEVKHVMIHVNPSEKKAVAV